MTKKERVLNELRQVKDSVYKKPVKKVTNGYYEKVNFDPQYIVDLIEQYPNDRDLGGKIRNYYIKLLEIKKTNK